MKRPGHSLNIITLAGMRTWFRFLPNTFTLGNLASGAAGIFLLWQGEVILASWMVLLAALLDLFDGLLARALGVSSALGRDLDSLADLVSFGVLPGQFMAWFILQAGGDIAGSLFAALVLPIAAAYRLARFNTDASQAVVFRGMPAPANGILLGTWPLAIVYGYGWGMEYIERLSQFPTAMLLVSAMAALLMVSRIPMLSFKISSLRETANFYRAAIIAVTLTALIFWGMAAVPVSVVLYLFFSILALPHLNGSRPVSS